MENFTRGLESIKKKSDGNLELKITERASLVVQWLRIYLAMQGHQFDPWSRKGRGPLRVVRKLRDGAQMLPTQFSLHFCLDCSYPPKLPLPHSFHLL